MSDVIIKNVPDGAEQMVKELAMVAIERYLKIRMIREDTEKVQQYEDAIDVIYLDNGLSAKYTKVEATPIKPEEGDIK